MGLTTQLTTLVFFIACSFLKVQGQIYKHKYNVLVDVPTYGKVEGFTVASFYHTKPNIRINHFLGVPFARRPSQFGDFRTEFRFQKPQKPSWTGIWDATYYRPACPQHPWYMRQYIPKFSNFSEDCLYLNIFAPNVTDEFPSPTPSLYPVMVYIHGGGYTVGSGQLWPGTMLAQRRVVVVTFNYRLNALGFLSTGDQHSPGNYGMWDQVAALEFVKDNIRYFRGDPHRITLVGHSTGASSVGLHLLSTRSGNTFNPLFHQAILMSGSDLSEWAVVDPQWHAHEYAKQLGYLVGCPTADNYQLVRCLQMSRTPDEIVNASIRVVVQQGRVANPWAPVVDGNTVGVAYAFLPDNPRKLREQGRFPHIRVIAGTAADDGSWFIPNLSSLPSGITDSQFENILREFLQDRGVQGLSRALNALRFQYTYWPQPKNNNSAVRQMATDLMSDYMFGSTVNEVLKLHADHNRTYFYTFNYKSYNDYLPPWRGVAHGQELQYLFGFPFFNETYLELTGIYPRQRYSYGDSNCSEFIMNMFTNFTSFGEPTSRYFDTHEFYNTSWKQYNLRNHSTFIIQNMSTSYNQLNYRQQSYAFWLNYYPILAGLIDDTRPKYIDKSESSQYTTATYSLTAGAALLLIIIIVIVLGFYCRRRKENDKFASDC